jgi:hypothetical protein
MVMGRELYSLLTNIPFRLPTNPGAAAVYVRAIETGQPANNAPLSRTEQALIDTSFNRRNDAEHRTCVFHGPRLEHQR